MSKLTPEEREAVLRDMAVDADLLMSQRVLTDESSEAQARRILSDAAPMAAMTLVNLAQYSEAPSVRLRAATEILNRTADAGQQDGKDPWENLYAKVVTGAEELLKGE
jgi:hypothetical protein